LERHKLFVSELSTETTRDTLKQIFAKFGEIKDVRIVTYKNGNSKGLAFVEFHSEDDAGKALVGLDGSTIDGKEIKIAISNPPARKGGQSNVSDKRSDSDKAHLQNANSSSGDYRGKGRSQVQLVPRSLVKPKPGAATVPTAEKKTELTSSSESTANDDAVDLKTESASPGKPLSNKDFAKFLKKT